MRKLILILFSIILLAGACKRTLPDYGATATVKMSNGWWVVLYEGSTAVTNPVFFTTYNTSSNTDSLWLDDLKHGYGFKVKTAVDLNALTFTGNGLANSYYIGTTAFPASVNITSGKVMLKAGHSRAGNITDSINIKAVFSDDPGETWTIAGVARTGFIEDDY
jgi:hypothetical protein